MRKILISDNFKKLSFVNNENKTLKNFCDLLRNEGFKSDLNRVFYFNKV